MRIEISSKLNQSQMMDDFKLEKESFKENGLHNHAFLSNEINFDNTLNCFYLLYVNNVLVSFLTTFIPTSKEAEILAVTHPNHRKKGYFSELFKHAKKTLLSNNIHKILLVVESNSKSALKVLRSLHNPELEFSEYRMSCKGSSSASQNKDFNICKVSRTNRGIFSQILQDAFPNLDQNSNLFDTMMHLKTRDNYLIYKNNNPIGVFNLNYENGDIFLHCVGIASPYRKQGFGKHLINLAIQEGLKTSDKVLLDVDSNTPAAFNLYKNCGFQIDFQIDYYRYKLCCNS